MIPKIIHHTAPSNKEDWHPLWFKCRESWKTHFQDFDYKMWNDEEIDLLVKNHYPRYWKMYNSFPAHIMKIDFVRFCFLHMYGGIYADMDTFCYKNFYNELSNDIYLLENPLGNDILENSIMISEPQHQFWIECMELTLVRYEYTKNKHFDLLNCIEPLLSDKKFGKTIRPFLIFFISGTNLLSTAARKTKNDIHTLPGLYYNNNDLSYHPEYRTKHIHTGLWGKENISIPTGKKTFKNISVDEYDFYTDYSCGRYLKTNIFDLDKNDCNVHLDCNNIYEYK